MQFGVVKTNKQENIQPHAISRQMKTWIQIPNVHFRKSTSEPQFARGDVLAM